jgi:hypothetical protein
MEIPDREVASVESRDVVVTAAAVKSARNVLNDRRLDPEWARDANSHGRTCLSLAPFGHILRPEGLEERATYVAWAREAFGEALTVAVAVRDACEMEASREGLARCDAAEAAPRGPHPRRAFSSKGRVLHRPRYVELGTFAR